MTKLDDRVKALEDKNIMQDTEISGVKSDVAVIKTDVAVIKTDQKNDSSRLKRIESVQWFVAGSIIVTLIAAVINQLLIK